MVSSKEEADVNHRIPLTGVLIALALTAPATADAALHRERSEQTFELAGLAALEVDNPRGEVDVRPGAGGKLEVTAEMSARAATDARARELAAGTVVETARENGAFVIRVRYPQHATIRIGWRDLLRGELQTPHVEVRLAIEVPPELMVSLRSASGDLMITGMKGALALATASGDVTVIQSHGPATVTTSSGDVEARDVNGLQIRTASGSVRLEKVSGPLTARTTSGMITVKDAGDSLMVRSVSGDILVGRAPRGLTASTSSGSIDARDVAGYADVSAANGDVDIALARPLSRATVSTVSGRISGRLAPDLACRLELRSASGDLEVLLPLKLESVSRREIVGVVQGGKAPVVLQTSAGDIELSSGGE